MEPITAVPMIAEAAVAAPVMSAETGVGLPLAEASFNEFNIAPASSTEIANIKAAVDLGDSGNTRDALQQIAAPPTETPPDSETSATPEEKNTPVAETQGQTPVAKDTGNEVDNKHPDGPLKPEDSKKIADQAGVDFAAGGTQQNTETQLPHDMTKEQYRKSQQAHYAREVANGRMSQEDADRTIAQSLERYDTEYTNLNPNEKSESDKTEQALTPEQRTAEIIEKIRDGEGDLLENLLELEGVQANMKGEDLTQEMRNTLADMLTEQMQEKGNLENQEALTVLKQIAEMFGLEAQLKQLPETMKVLDKQADQLDQKINTLSKKFSTTNNVISTKERNELYASYIQLTNVEVQMVNLMQLQDKMEQRFKEISNNIDFTLGRKGSFSYAVGAVKNSFHGFALQLSTPNLRSARHRKSLGF